MSEKKEYVVLSNKDKEGYIGSKVGSKLEELIQYELPVLRPEIKKRSLQGENKIDEGEVVGSEIIFTINTYVYLKTVLEYKGVNREKIHDLEIYDVCPVYSSKKSEENIWIFSEEHYDNYGKKNITKRYKRLKKEIQEKSDESKKPEVEEMTDKVIERKLEKKENKQLTDGLSLDNFLKRNNYLEKKLKRILLKHNSKKEFARRTVEKMIKGIEYLEKKYFSD